MSAVEPTAAEIAEAELAHGITALRERIYYNPEGVRSLRAAVSANGRWGYEREGRSWVVIDKTEREGLHFAASLQHARQITFDLDHPIHTVPREPRPMRFTIV